MSNWVTEDVEKMYCEKIASSGITAMQAKELKFSYISVEESKAEQLWWAHPVPALKIPYFDPCTGAPLAAGPKFPQFFRARALREPTPKPKTFHKYTQPPRTGVCAYFPQIKTIDWPAVLGDDSSMLLITEGELKAAKACIEGYPTIGLGGVYNYQSSANGVIFLPELEKVHWVRREVYIVYDSDIIQNVAVATAAWRLTKELYDRGAITRLVIIPSVGDKDSKKAGLDDYLISDGKSGLDYLLQGASHLTAVEALFEMNSRIALLLEGDHEVVDLKWASKMKATQLTYRTAKTVDERVLRSDGKISHERVNAASLWLTWPLHTVARRLIYNPSLPAKQLVESEDGEIDFNTWPGLRVFPIKGDVSPFTILIDHLFTGAEQGIKKWFLDWLAYPLQNLGTKLLSAVMLHGLVHGSGKTLVGETMRRIYGSAYTKIGHSELTTPHNEWAASRSFILGDDITGMDKLEIHDTLKVMITQTTMRINPKGLTAYELDDHINWLFTSNRPNAFIIDNGDRRFMVWEVPASVGKLERQFYIDYMTWLDGDGAAALLYWFLKRDVSKFDPGDAAPETKAKRKMREEARSDIANWVGDLRMNADEMLTAPGDLFTNLQLRAMYTAQANVRSDDPNLPTRMGAALSAAGFPQVHEGKMVKGKGFPTARYYAIRNVDKWKDAPLSGIQRHLTELMQPLEKKY